MMRLPRVQISLRQLLCIIAIVALNAGVFRSVYQTAGTAHGGFPLSNRWMEYYSFEHGHVPSVHSFTFAIGFIPLLNAALIGILLYLGRRVRSSRSIPAEITPAPAGFTFFNLHCLALGCVVVVVAPIVIATYALIVENALEPTGVRVVGFFAHFGDSVPWLVLECLILCLAISGPPLAHFLDRRLCREALCREAAAATFQGDERPDVIWLCGRGAGDHVDADRVRRGTRHPA